MEVYTLVPQSKLFLLQLLLVHVLLQASQDLLYTFGAFACLITIFLFNFSDDRVSMAEVSEINDVDTFVSILPIGKCSQTQDHYLLQCFLNSELLQLFEVIRDDEIRKVHSCQILDRVFI